MARYVHESIWHPSQVLTRQRDGSLVAEYQLGTTEEFQSWVLSFGSKAVIVEPAELRREITEGLRATLAAYENLRPQEPPRTSSRTARARTPSSRPPGGAPAL